MGVRITPPDGQPVHASSSFFMQATSAETNVASVAAYLGLPVKVLTTFVKDSPIARLIKDTRDKDYQTHNAKNELVNRVESIGHYGSSNIGNEECWTLSVACRAMGLVYIDHQARV